MSSTARLLSGGVDSSVAMVRLLEQGIRPDLFYIRIGAKEEGYAGCPAEDDEVIVRILARKYDLPLEMIDLHREYWDHVVGYLLESVRRGLTPNPDMMCNRWIKFGAFDSCTGSTYDHIATGHYALKETIDGRDYLATAVDPVKDQTDFLAQITYPQLHKALFPIGDLPKERLRAIAEEHHLVTAHRDDSQGICFLGRIDYDDFLREHLGDRVGPIVELETGRVLGEHRGFWYHTIGQRKGLGLSGGPWYVIRKDVATNTIFVSRGFDTAMQYSDLIRLGAMNFISGDPMPEGVDEMPVTLKVRHTPDFTRGLLRRHADGSHSVLAEEPIQGVAAGQFCTLYDTEEHLCYGSGVIAEGLQSDAADKISEVKL